MLNALSWAYFAFLFMPTAGYSGTPLLQKLGIKPGHKLLVINKPDNYSRLIQADISNQLCDKNATPDVVHLFAENKADFENEMRELKSIVKKNRNIVIWVSWYKKSSGAATDVNEDVIRNYGLKNDLVDIKVCAVSDIWSGLKLVVPVKLR